MFFINIYIKILSNNTFIIVSNKDSKVLKVESMGSIGFKHKEKKIIEGFELLIDQIKSYITANHWLINELKIVSATRSKLQHIKELLLLHRVNLCKIVEKNSYNGCRLKKQKRKKRKLKIKVYKRF